MCCEICLIMVLLCKLKQLICEISVGWLKLLSVTPIRYLDRAYNCVGSVVAFGVCVCYLLNK